MSPRAPLLLRTAWPVLAFCGSFTAPATLSAHEIHVFAYAQGRSIHGEVSDAAGSPVRGATVTVLDPAGQTLTIETTGDDGRFSFEARFHCDHRLLVDAGGGHAAHFTVWAEELSDELLDDRFDELPDDLWNGLPDELPDELPNELSGHTDSPVATTGRSHDTDLDALAKQIVALRRQIEEYQRKTRLQDVLGAVGYIIGMMGLAFYFLGVRRKQTPPTPGATDP